MHWKGLSSVHLLSVLHMEVVRECLLCLRKVYHVREKMRCVILNAYHQIYPRVVSKSAGV